MIQACENILSYTEEMEFEQFVANNMVYDAVLRNLEIIGEAAKKIPADITHRYTKVPWRSISGLRDILAHVYFALDDPTLWDIVHNRIPFLLEQLRDILEKET